MSDRRDVRRVFIAESEIPIKALQAAAATEDVEAATQLFSNAGDRAVTDIQRQMQMALHDVDPDSPPVIKVVVIQIAKPIL